MGAEKKRARGVRRIHLLIVALAAVVGLAWSAPSASAAPGDPPLYLFAPWPLHNHQLEPPPTGYFNGPCGLAIDGLGRIWISDYYHRAVSVFQSDGGKLAAHEGLLAQLLAEWSKPESHTGKVDDPCELALRRHQPDPLRQQLPPQRRQVSGNERDRSRGRQRRLRRGDDRGRGRPFQPTIST